MESPSNGLSEAMMKIKRAQGFHPKRVKFDFHTNPDESPSNGLSEAMMKIKRAQGFHPKRVKFDFHTKLPCIQFIILLKYQ
jgi:lipocalin